MVRFEVYKDIRGEYRWRAVAGNKQVVGDSSEGYINKNDCLAGIDLVRSASFEVRDITNNGNNPTAEGENGQSQVQ